LLNRKMAQWRSE